MASPAKRSSGEAAVAERQMPKFYIPAKAGAWVGSYAGVGLEFRLRDEETGKPVHFVLCGADLSELVRQAEAVRAELEGDEPDDEGEADG